MEGKIDVGTGRPVYAIGVMTGTSMDEVDIAIIRTDGETVAEFVDAESFEIPDLDRDLIRLAIRHLPMVPTASLRPIMGNPMEAGGAHWLKGIHKTLLDLTGYALERYVLDPGNLADDAAAQPWRTMIDAPQSVALGIHGQTVLHRPDEAFTLQIAMPSTGDTWVGSRFTTVTDFRSADMVAGGQGAPLAPFYHFALARHIGAADPVAFLNLGGVGNVTWVDPAKDAPEDPGALIAFDTGPGNALVNDWMQAQAGELLDRDGAAAARGRVHRDRLATNSGQAYLDRRPPKSLDRNDFHGVLAAMEGLSTEDGAATLTAFTADCVAQAMRHMPVPPSRWLVCGGGRKNRTMMRMLAKRLDTPVDPVDAVGLDGDMLEAQAFAYLAVRVLRGLPTSSPSTTGCTVPVSGGRIISPAD